MLLRENVIKRPKTEGGLQQIPATCHDLIAWRSNPSLPSLNTSLRTPSLFYTHSKRLSFKREHPPPSASDPNHFPSFHEPYSRSEPQFCCPVRWKFRTISITLSPSLSLWAPRRPFLSPIQTLTLRHQTVTEDRFRASMDASRRHCEFSPSFSL